MQRQEDMHTANVVDPGVISSNQHKHPCAEEFQELNDSQPSIGSSASDLKTRTPQSTAVRSRAMNKKNALLQPGTMSGTKKGVNTVKNKKENEKEKRIGHKEKLQLFKTPKQSGDSQATASLTKHIQDMEVDGDTEIAMPVNTEQKAKNVLPKKGHVGQDSSKAKTAAPLKLAAFYQGSTSSETAGCCNNNESTEDTNTDSLVDQASVRAPGAFRVAGMNGDEGDDISALPDDFTTSVASTAATQGTFTVPTAQVSTQPEHGFVVPIARTVDSTVVQAVPAGDDGYKHRQRRIISCIVVGVLVIIGVILAVVFGRNSGGDNSTDASGVIPTLSPTAHGGMWIQRGTGIVGDEPGDESGIYVAMNSDGSVLAIAAQMNNGTNGDASGQVRVFTWLNETAEWIQQGADIDGEAAGDRSGTALALSSDGLILAVGAFLNDGEGQEDTGHCRVYKWDGTNWLQRGRDLDGELPGDRSGFSVALSSDGSILAIGAPVNHNLNGLYAGHARVYQYDSSEAIEDWIQLGEDIDGEHPGDFSGESVSLSSDGHIIAIGAFRNDGVDQMFDKAGHVRVYQWSMDSGTASGGGWMQRGSDIDGVAAGDEAGTSPSVVLTSDGNTVAVGASKYDGPKGIDSGHVRVFDWSAVEGDWVQRGQSIDGDSGDESGTAVAISSDGKTVIIGALLNRQNGSDAGTARVFSWDGSGWIQIGDDIDGERTGDNTGVAVAMSSDGSVISVGAPNNDRNDRQNSGLVRVYELIE